jgi:glycosyltransferase involved in cell wall biosynthesis
MTETVIVVPCYNEAQRLPVDEFRRYCEAHPSVRFIFVNDGSTDTTLDLLEQLAREHPRQISAIDQGSNTGKAATVRTGMQQGFKSGATYAGYWDADLATGLDELARFVQILDHDPQLEMVFGARVKLLGRDIQRRAIRHYPGRIFATLASLTLGLPVYDTQCGAKLFRTSPDMVAIFEEPFITNWIFDVEIVARLIRARRHSKQPSAQKAIYELPLQAWQDVPGSTIRAADFARAIWGLARIYWHTLRR